LATFQAGGVRNKVHVAVDGEDALVFLRRQGKHAGAPRPDIVLLDLNLPKKSGREVLAEIKADPQLLDIPVVVLTVSQEESDILQTYDLRAHSYLTKPLLLDQVMKMIQSIEEFELVIVKRPTA
jgi:CheY-like chemotaxis protein